MQATLSSPVVNQISSSHSELIYWDGYSYVNDLSGLYNQYLEDNRLLHKLIKKQIGNVNDTIEKYISRKEDTYALLCEDDNEKALASAQQLSQIMEVFVKALNLIYKNTTDRGLKVLLSSSIEVLQKFILRLCDYIDIYSELINKKEDADEDGEDYDNKIGQIAEFILNKNNSKPGNSIRELLGV